MAINSELSGDLFIFNNGVETVVGNLLLKCLTLAMKRKTIYKILKPCMKSAIINIWRKCLLFIFVTEEMLISKIVVFLLYPEC